MLKEQLLHEYPGVLDAFVDVRPLGDQDLWPLSEGLHRALLTQSVNYAEAGEVYHLERIGESFHGRRNLGEAGRYYLQVLEKDPPREPTQAQRLAILRHAPLLLTTREEAFPLKDVVAIHHPEKLLIAYHLFWEDDYNFPDDYEPCDHEQLWVAYEPATETLTEVRAFFHSRILGSPEAVEEANASGGRAKIRVEWGLHGSLVAGWETIKFPEGHTVESWLKENFLGVKEGGRVKEHPIKKRWPKNYPGTWDDYRRFDQPVDAAQWLEKKGMMLVGRWANAIIQQHCLTYNFSVKFDWPFDLVSLGRPRVGR